MSLMESTEGASRGCVSQADMTRAAQKGGEPPIDIGPETAPAALWPPEIAAVAAAGARGVPSSGSFRPAQQSKKGRPKAAVRGGAVGDCMTRRPLRRVSCACRGGAI